MTCYVSSWTLNPRHSLTAFALHYYCSHLVELLRVICSYWLLLQHLGDSCQVLEDIASGKHPFAKVGVMNVVILSMFYF